MTFLKSYIHFENEENNIIFEKHLEQITERTTTMGIEEMVLVDREKRGEKRGVERVILNMIRKNFADEVIADAVGFPLDYVQKIRASSKS